MLLSRRRAFSLIYTAVAAIAIVFLLTTSVSAYVLKTFSYESHYIMENGYTVSQKKTDSSDAVVYYADGSNKYDLNVQLWGSDGTSADAYNFTTGDTIVVENGHVENIPNTAYQYYNGGKCYVRLKMWVLYTGTVSGKWSHTTK